MTEQTRVRIKNGQKVAEIQTPAIRGNGWNKTGEHYSAEDHAALGWLIPVYAAIPEGAVAHVVEWQREILQMEVIIDGKVAVPMIYGNHAIQIVHEYWTAEEIAAKNAEAEADAQTQAQADRHNQVLAMTDAYGGMIAALGYSLQAVGHEIPCESADVTADLIQRSLEGTLTDAQQNAKSDIADIYILLAGAGVTDADIAAVWSLVVNRRGIS